MRRFFLAVLLVVSQVSFLLDAKAGYEVKSVKLFKDGNLCIKDSAGTESSLDITKFIVDSESVAASISSGGAVCSAAPIFTGGANLISVNGVSTQAQPVVQAYGLGILISETAGSDPAMDGGVSSSGDPNAFSNTLVNIGGNSGLNDQQTIFEIQLPQECDIVDDDNLATGTSSNLTTINDFSFITCSSSPSLTLNCSSEFGLLTKENALIPRNGTEPAKIRFTVSRTASSDPSMIDSALIKIDSQDILCPTTTNGPLSVTILAKDMVDNPSKTETIGTVDLATPIQAISVKYASSVATSAQGETSTNEVGTTPVLSMTSSTTLNPIVVEELNELSLPIGDQSSVFIIDQLTTGNKTEITTVNLWLTPPKGGFFATAPALGDIAFSDNSLVAGTPFIVMSSSDDFDAPIGSLVIPITKNLATSVTNPSTVKTKITINNIKVGAIDSTFDPATITFAIYEPISDAVVNTPGTGSIYNTNIDTNPQNFSAFGVGTVRAQNQNIVIGTSSAPNATFTNQATTDVDLGLVTARATALGAPQLTNTFNVVSSVSTADDTKISTSVSGSVLTVTGTTGATTPGASVKLTIPNGDSVTILSKADGSFVAKLKKASADTALSISQTISGTEGSSVSLNLPGTSSNSCATTQECQSQIGDNPTVTDVVNFINSNGGLSSVISSGGAALEAVINSLATALGIS